MTDRVIYVAGVPNGGTSCVAGILHHLGVDMGDVESEPRARSYLTFEDRRFAEYKAPRFREYLEMRLAESDGRRVGVKCAAWAWMDDPEPETLPVDVLIVRRPLEDSMRSSMRLWRVDRSEVLAMQEHPRKFIMDKVAGVGRAFAAVEMLRDLATDIPCFSIEFRDMFNDPDGLVNWMDERLGLLGSQAAFLRACAFIDPSKVHFP